MLPPGTQIHLFNFCFILHHLWLFKNLLVEFGSLMFLVRMNIVCTVICDCVDLLLEYGFWSIWLIAQREWWLLQNGVGFLICSERRWVMLPGLLIFLRDPGNVCFNVTFNFLKIIIKVRGRILQSVVCSAHSCPTLCDPMNRSTPGLPVHHQLPESTQTHVHRVGDAIQPSHPL